MVSAFKVELMQRYLNVYCPNILGSRRGPELHSMKPRILS